MDLSGNPAVGFHFTGISTLPTWIFKTPENYLIKEKGRAIRTR